MARGNAEIKNFPRATRILMKRRGSLSPQSTFYGKAHKAVRCAKKFKILFFSATKFCQYSAPKDDHDGCLYKKAKKYWKEGT